MTSNVAQLGGGIQHRFRLLFSPLWQAEARFRGVEIGKDCEFHGRPVITREAGSTLRLGMGVRLNNSLRTNPLGCAHPCILRTLSHGAELLIGAGTGLSGAVVCAAVRVEIGSGTLVGSGAMIFDTDFHTPQAGGGWNDDSRIGAEPVRIGQGVFIGTRAIILKGVTLGDGAVIGAGAVVTRSVGPREVVAGNPARVISSGVLMVGQ